MFEKARLVLAKLMKLKYFIVGTNDEAYVCYNDWTTSIEYF